MAESDKLKRVRDAIADYPDFPKPGIVFKDIFPILRQPAVLSDLIDLMASHVKSLNVDVVVGVEARGFLFGPLICDRLSLPFVPIRKKGKLPGETVQEAYDLEYGKDVSEAQVGSITEGQRVCIVDDLIATGGTLEAACKLIEKMKAVPVECLVIISLKELQGYKKVHVKVHTLLEMSDHS